MALHNAGWSGKEIAEEMDISPATVSKYIKKIKYINGGKNNDGSNN